MAATEAALSDACALVVDRFEEARRQVEALCAALPDEGWAGQDLTEARAHWRAGYEAFLEGEVPASFLLNTTVEAVALIYEELLPWGADPEPFDATGHLGFHALERILFADVAPAVIAPLEARHPNAADARTPQTAAEAAQLKSGLCRQLSESLAALAERSKDRTVTPEMGALGLAISLDRQFQRVDVGTQGLYEARYSEHTLAAMKASLRGDQQMLAILKPLADLAPDTAAVHQLLAADLDRLQQEYAAAGERQLPPAPAGFSQHGPAPGTSPDDPYVRLWWVLKTARDMSDPAMAGGRAIALSRRLADLSRDALLVQETGLLAVGSPPGFEPAAGLSPEWQHRFDEGQVIFTAAFSEGTGLGPLYIRDACNSCHFQDRSAERVSVLKLVSRGPGGAPVGGGEFPFGRTVRTEVAAGATTPLTTPANDDPDLTHVVRASPAIFGLGYLEAVSDEAIEALAVAQAEHGLVSGRVQRVAFPEGGSDPEFHAFSAGEPNLIGRFGLKASSPTLDAFNALAFRTDMSLTSAWYPNELPNPDGLTDDRVPGGDLADDTVRRVSDFIRAIGIPERPDPDPVGEALFGAVGCGTCHQPRLPTRADYPISALAGIEAPIYTDLLLHDMGAGLADYVEEGLAGPGEWRTAPLIGMWLRPSYLHDGRARTVEDAILEHGGPGSEADFAVQAFEALSPAERAALITFVEGL